jgi:hypothetical protein
MLFVSACGTRARERGLPMILAGVNRQVAQQLPPEQGKNPQNQPDLLVCQVANMYSIVLKGIVVLVVHSVTHHSRSGGAGQCRLIKHSMYCNTGQ